jgi:hypothetical protein
MDPLLATTGPEAAVYIALIVAVLVLISAALAAFLDLRKTRMVAEQEDELRQVIRRYEHLAENSLDAQQRTATDLSELRTRTTAIEQILRTVE